MSLTKKMFPAKLLIRLIPSTLASAKDGTVLRWGENEIANCLQFQWDPRIFPIFCNVVISSLRTRDFISNDESLSSTSSEIAFDVELIVLYTLHYISSLSPGV
ncbi:hypothetical protein ACTXT7_008506 [Hymenolepis weldensis]